jgi:histone H3/H4
MRKALPAQGKLSKEATMCMQECVSEFISFVTSGAVDKCQAEKRKTLTGDDVLYAMYTLGFENYAETLKIYLAKYRENESLDAEARREKDKRKRQKRKEKKELEKLQKEVTQADQGGVGSTEGDEGLKTDALQNVLIIPEQSLSDFGLESQDMGQFVMGPVDQTDYQDGLSF